MFPNLTAQQRKKIFTLILLTLGLAYGEMAFALTMPWENTLCGVFQSLSGRTAQAVAGIIIVLTGLGWASGEAKGWFKTGLGVVCGLSVAFGAASFLGMFGQGSC